MVRKSMRARRLSGILGSLVILGVLVASCGTSAASTSTKLAPLTIEYASIGAGFSDLYVGVSQGIFKQHGLDVKLVQVTPAALVPALLSGSADIGGGVADTTASAILKGEKLKYVALTEGTYNLQLWVNPAKVKSISDLQGQSVALTTEGSETDFGLTALLQEHGISPSKVGRKYLVKTPEMISAMSSGAVAAGLFQPPNAQVLLKSGDRILTSLTNLPYAVGAYISPTSYIDKHPTVMNEFFQAEEQNLAYLRSHPTQTKAAIMKYNPGTTAGDANIAYKFFLNVWKKNPNVTPALINAAFKRAAQSAGVTPPNSMSPYIWRSQG